MYGSRIISTFVDLFHGCYKDGTSGMHDLRFTAGLYLSIRLVVLLSLILCNFSIHNSCETVSVFLWVFLLLLFIALVRPYKDQQMNFLDSLLLAGLAVICVLFTSIYPTVKNHHINVLMLIVIFIIIGMPQAVLITYVAFKICPYLCKPLFFIS